MKHVAQVGVTSVQDLPGGEADVPAWAALRDAGAMTVRVNYRPSLGDWPKAEELQSSMKNDEWFRIGGVKGFMDGSLGSGTAMMFEAVRRRARQQGRLRRRRDPALEDRGADRGAPTRPASRSRSTRSATGPTRSCSTSTSASRSRTARATGASASSTPSTCAPADIPRFAELGVIASMQPYHAVDDGRWAEKRLGADARADDLRVPLAARRQGRASRSARTGTSRRSRRSSASPPPSPAARSTARTPTAGSPRRRSPSRRRCAPTPSRRPTPASRRRRRGRSRPASSATSSSSPRTRSARSSRTSRRSRSTDGRRRKGRLLAVRERAGGPSSRPQTVRSEPSVTREAGDDTLLRRTATAVQRRDNPWLRGKANQETTGCQPGIIAAASTDVGLGGEA